MRAPRRPGLAPIACVGLAFVAFGVDDLTMDAPPPMQERYFERIGGVSDEVRAFALAAFDGQGGLFVAAGLGLLAPRSGADPARRALGGRDRRRDDRLRQRRAHPRRHPASRPAIFRWTSCSPLGWPVAGWSPSRPVGRDDPAAPESEFRSRGKPFPWPRLRAVRGGAGRCRRAATSRCFSSQRVALPQSAPILL
jgi:hypothetical protein